MAGNKRFDDAVRQWLEEQAPLHLPDRVLEATFERTLGTRQKVGWRGLPRRLRINGFAPAFGAAVVMIVAATFAFALGGNLGIGVFATPAPTPSSPPPPTPSPRPLPASVPLSAGTYLFDNGLFTTVPFQFTVPDGWVVQSGGAIITKDQPDELGFTVSTLDTIHADACAGTDGEVVDAGSTVGDLVTALLAQAGPVIEGPFDVTFGGYPGQRLDVTSPPAADLVGCNLTDALQLWRDQAGGYAVVFADWQTSIYVVDVGGDRVVLMTVRQTASPAADVAELTAVIDSIEFQP